MSTSKFLYLIKTIDDNKVQLVTKVDTFQSRVKSGWTLEEAITGVKLSRAYYDHLGKEYKSQKDMCKAYGVEPATYQARIKRGWTVERALLSE